jgi:hypothetical protein
MNPKFRIPGKHLESSTTGILSRNKNPMKKKKSPVHTPSIHGGMFMGASSLWPMGASMERAPQKASPCISIL